MRKRGGGGQVFAAKLWTKLNIPQPNLTHLDVLSELSALLKVNDGWHACDELDRAWCPLVQLHGLFLRPRGLLMEQVRHGSPGVSIGAAVARAERSAPHAVRGVALRRAGQRPQAR